VITGESCDAAKVISERRWSVVSRSWSQLINKTPPASGAQTSRARMPVSIERPIPCRHRSLWTAMTARD